MEIPAAIAAQMAITRSNAAMGMLKMSADADKAIANMLMETIDNVPTGRRGGIVNFFA